MHTIHSFSFVREMWSELRCTSGLPSWTFAHAVAYGDWLCARTGLSALCLACRWVPSAHVFLVKKVLVVCVGVCLAVMGAGHDMMTERSEGLMWCVC